MFRASAVLLLGFLLAAIPVGAPTNPISSENLHPSSQGAEMSFVLELVQGYPQRKTARRERVIARFASGGESPPLFQCDRAPELETLAAVEMAFLVEVIVD